MTDHKDVYQELREAQAEIERLRARVGWLDHLDTEEGRKVHANEILLVEIEWLKSDLYHAIQALHCSAPNEVMSVEEIRAWLEIRNTLSDKYKECTP